MMPGTASFWTSGLTDGFGICGFTGLLFLIWFLVSVCRGRLQVAAGGLIYVGVVFWTMTSMGLGFFNWIITSDFFVTGARIFYSAVALLAFVLGCLSFYDWLLCRGIVKSGRQRFTFRFSDDQGRAGAIQPAWKRRLKVCVAVLGVIAGAGISAFLLTLLASLRCPQPFVTAMIYSLSVDKMILKAIGGMLTYSLAYVAPLIAAWVSILGLLQLRRRNRGLQLGISQMKIASSAVLFALSFGLMYVLL